MASAVDNFYWFFVFFSVLGGVGSGLILVQGNVSVQQYFSTKRATANGVFMSGGAIGNMTMPIILRYTYIN
jgi:MFS family permease